MGGFIYMGRATRQEKAEAKRRVKEEARRKEDERRAKARMEKEKRKNARHSSRGKTDQEKEMKIPQNMNDSIPYKRVYESGIIEVENGVFSKSWRLPEANFKTSEQSRQETMAEQWGFMLGKFERGASIQVTLYNRTVDPAKFQEHVMLPMKSDALNKYREEINSMLLDKMSGAKNNLQIEKYLTVSIHAKDIEEATNSFGQINSIIMEDITQIAKKEPEPVSIMDRLEILNSIYNQDTVQPLNTERVIAGHLVKSFSLENCARQGITTKDAIAPEMLGFSSMDFMVGKNYGRTLYISNFPTWIKGTILTDFSSIPCNMLTSVYFNPIPTDDAVKLIRRQGVNISSTLVEIQRRASQRGIDPGLINPDLNDAKSEADELLSEITKDNYQLFTCNMLITIFAPDRDALDRYEGQVKLIANKNLLTAKVLGQQQEYAFDSSLPLANNKIRLQRLMTTETVAAIIPFDVKEVRQEGGMYYGLNASSGNMILYNRTSDVNMNACILGMPGAGKSFAAKREMINVLLNTDDEIYILDPEREYMQLAKNMGGSIIKMAQGSNVHINPFDMHLDNVGDDGNDPVKIKCDFISTICEIAVGGRYGLSPVERSLIDRCTIKVYEPYMEYLMKTGKRIDTEHAPTLVDFYDELRVQPHPEAQTIALALERYVHGAADLFAYKTNVEIDNRFTIYDIKDIGGLKELGLQICLDNIWNKMIQNRQQGKRTWMYIDEFYLMMQKPTSAQYIAEIWKRARKWAGLPCAITQNVEDMLKSEQARTIINNSSFIMLLGQSPINKKQLSQLLNISPEEQKYISAAKPGMGLLRIGGDGNEDIIPFDDSFPKSTELYKIMTTKPDDLAEFKALK